MPNDYDVQVAISCRNYLACQTCGDARPLAVIFLSSAWQLQLF